MNAPPENDDWERRPPRGAWQLMPKRTLVKAVWLLGLLAGVVWFQSRSMSCARTFTEQVMPPAQPRHVSPDDRGRVVRIAEPPTPVPQPPPSQTTKP